MSKYQTKHCVLRDTLDNRTFSVIIALGQWDGVEDAEDEAIFYYMDGEPLVVGAVVSEDYVVVSIDEDDNG
jgi:hypothetical protein